MRRNDFQGFSLIETTIVLFLAAAMLFCVGKLTAETLSTLKFLQEKSATTESATLACQRLAAELSETISVPDLSDGVRFRKVTPSEDSLVGNLAISDPGSWRYEYLSSQQSEIRYSQTGDKVFRQVGSETALEVATKVNIFLVKQYSSSRRGAYRVTLTILEKRRPVTFETIVVCPGVPQ